LRSIDATGAESATWISEKDAGEIWNAGDWFNASQYSMPLELLEMTTTEYTSTVKGDSL
jgi:hypothetical protein